MATITNGNGDSNGHTRPSRPLKPGINTPLVAFFDPSTEDLDLSTTATHAVRLARAGMTSLTTQGSNGEAVHLTPQERSAITSTVRSALDAAGFTQLPIVAGCAAQSVRETISLCREAYTAGADYALILPPCYYKANYTPAAIHDYFVSVADASPIPLIIYNYPGAVAGVDLSSDAIIALAKAHPNIQGCKLTCGNTGKLARIAAALDDKIATPSSPSPSDPQHQSSPSWMLMGGSADFTLQTLIAGGSGTIAGLGNIIPKLCVRVSDLYASGKVAEAQKLQAIVARADWAVIQGGVCGTKAALREFWGYGGFARRPLVEPAGEVVDGWADCLREAVGVEKGL